MKHKLIIFVFVVCIGFAYANDQIILKLKPTKSNANKITQLSVKQINHLSDIAGYKIQSVRPIASGAQVIKFDNNLTKAQMQTVINNLKTETNVEYVVEDRRMQHMRRQTLDVQ